MERGPLPADHDPAAAELAASLDPSGSPQGHYAILVNQPPNATYFPEVKQ